MLDSSATPPPPADATPLMAQYLALKAQNPDCMLFFRVGDFYELFFEDAVNAARTIGLTLTKRGKHLGEDVPLAGVPVHTVDDYLAKLIQAGFRVAMAEQMEAAEEAKKRGYKAIVTRDVIRIVTAGTLTEERLLIPSRPSRLCALAFSDDQTLCSIACTDISTGQFVVRCVPVGQVLDMLVALSPAEVLLPDLTPVKLDEVRAYCNGRNIQIAHYPAIRLNAEDAERRITGYFGVMDSAVFGAFSAGDLISIASVLYYIDRTQKGLAVPLSPPVQASAAHTVLMDAATRNNLEITETLSGRYEGSLLSVMDHTVSGAGARTLLDWLSQPTTSLPLIHARQAAIEFAFAHAKWRADMRGLLKSMPDIARSLTRLSIERGGPRDMRAIRAGLDAANAIQRLFTRVDVQETEALREIQNTLALMPENLAEHLEAALVDEPPMNVADGGFVRAGFDVELDEVRRLRDESQNIIAGIEVKLKEETGIRSLKIRHNNVLGYYIEVSAQFGETLREDAQKRFILRQSLPNATRFTTVELAELESKIASAATEALSRERMIFASLREAVLEERQSLKDIHDAMATLDVILSLAQVAEAEKWVRPLVDDSLAFDITDGRHVVVEHALKHGNHNPFIANSLNLSPLVQDDSGQIALVTGPNMGGKSTFLRQNALIALLAHIGSFVPAKEAHIGVVDRIFSRVGASDDLARGRSTFMVEMVETASILNQATQQSFVILDEIGRGTATWDGLSIAWATLEHLHDANRSRTIFATHFHELTELKARLTRLRNLNVAVKEWNNQLIFLHTIAEGVADRSYGIHVAEKAGIPRAVIARAKTLLTRLEKGMDRKKPSELLAELPLFAALEVEPEVQKLEPWQEAILTEIVNINPDDLNPRAALDAIYRLKGMVK